MAKSSFVPAIHEGTETYKCEYKDHFCLLELVHIERNEFSVRHQNCLNANKNFSFVLFHREKKTLQKLKIGVSANS